VAGETDHKVEGCYIFMLFPIFVNWSEKKTSTIPIHYFQYKDDPLGAGGKKRISKMVQYS